MVNRPDIKDKENWDKLPKKKRLYYYTRRCRMKKKGIYFADAEFYPKKPVCKKRYLREYYRKNRDTICAKMRQKYHYKKLMKELKQKVKIIN